MARAVGFVVGAVAARAVQFPGVCDGEVADCDAPAPVVLDNFVVCAGGATAGDEDIAGAEEGDGVCGVLFVMMAWS